MKPLSWPLLCFLLALGLVACGKDAPPPAPVVVQIPAASRDVAQGVDVSASDGVVQLYGTVGSESERRDAAKIAGAIAGVTSVQNKIVVVKGS